MQRTRAPTTVDRATDRPLLGIFLIVLAMIILPIMDAITKHLGTTLPVTQIVWARFAFHLAVILPYVLHGFGPGALVPPLPRLQLLRSGCMILATMLFIAGLRFLPVADALALFFVAPLIVTALAPVFLKEQVGLRRWLAVVVGFCGTLIIIRPGFAEVTGGTFLALGAGAAFGSYLLVTRRLSGSTNPLVTHSFTGIVGTAVMSCAIPFLWVPPTLLEWVLLISVGLISALGHYLILRAYDFATAPILAPFAYTEIVMATVVGYVWFGDVLDRWTALGVAILVGSSIYISLREGGRRLRRP